MPVSDTNLGGISIDFSGSVDEICLSVTKSLECITTISINTVVVKQLKCVCVKILEVISDSRKNPNPYQKIENLITLHDDVLASIYKVCSDVSEETQVAAFKALLELLPLQVVLGKRITFPDNYFAEILKFSIFSKKPIGTFLPHLEELLIHEDISKNIWKALYLACSKETLSPDHVSNVLVIVDKTEKPNAKAVNDDSGPDQSHYCTSEGVLADKDIGKYIKHLWERLSAVDLPPKILQNLLLTLLEKFMPRMKRPIFLTDFFINSLEHGGSISILALQGIFLLYKDENMNYPNVYKKLYSMITPEIFCAQYKARFYYLTDIFLTSSHLPEAMVGGFVKRFARLSLVAPPPDAVILLSFIVNLLIRHRGLKKLLHNPSSITYETDPYKPEEVSPELSHAMESSLWEVQLLQSHVVPRVSAATHFLNNPLPSVEVDLSSLLETTIEEMFLREHKKKMKEPPLSFEKPTSLLVPSVPNNPFNLWSLSR